MVGYTGVGGGEREKERERNELKEKQFCCCCEQFGLPSLQAALAENSSDRIFEWLS
jgi:hypothetical protein